MIWHGQKSWNGVAILARGVNSVGTRRGLPGDPDDLQSRYIEGIVRDRLIGCLISEWKSGARSEFDCKLRWFERLIDYADKPFATALPSYWRRL